MAQFQHGIATQNVLDNAIVIVNEVHKLAARFESSNLKLLPRQLMTATNVACCVAHCHLTLDVRLQTWLRFLGLSWASSQRKAVAQSPGGKQWASTSKDAAHLLSAPLRRSEGQ